VKRFSIFSKMFLLFVCFSIVLSAQNAGSTVADVLNIPYVEYAPVINGELDEDWVFGFPNVQMFGYIFEQADSFHGYSDCASFYKVAWNEDGVYFYGEVADDSVTGEADAANSHNNDCWEIYFDGDNSKTAPYDKNDVQWRWVYGKTEIESGWADCGEWAWLKTADGYSFELKIPASELVKAEAQLFPLEEGQVIGFETQVADNDGSVREVMTKWWAADNNSWQDPGLFGTAVLDDDDVTLWISSLEFTPTIDGELGDEWVDIFGYYELPEVKMTVYINEAGMFDGDSDISSYYRAAWSEKGFCFFGRVIDDSIYTGDPEPQNNDCFELYFDGGNEKASEYDDNDIRWRWVYGKTEIEPGWADCGTWAWKETEVGWNFELFIPFKEMVKNGNPLFPLKEGGFTIGWEVQVNDNDGGGRKSMTKWWSESNNSSQDPSLFGTADFYLYDIDTSGISEPDSPGIGLSVPSFPLNSTACISYTIDSRNAVKITLYDLAGRAVLTLYKGIKDPGTFTLHVDLSGLANGVYLCRLEAGNNATTKKITLIK
jgi:hypothetical protein